MIKLLLGGSPCQHWSIAQKNSRETEPSGIGWELFKNYLIAKEKFKPDYFLYENNKSAAEPIKAQIRKELNVWDGTVFTSYSDAQYIEINSALVSAQNRQRFYVHNFPNVGQPQDRGILLKDVLDSGVAWQEKGYALTTRCNGAIPEDTLEKRRHTMVAEPVIFQTPHGHNEGGVKYEKSPTLTANGCWEHNNRVVEPVCIQEQVRGRKANTDGTYDRVYEARVDSKSGAVTGTNRQNAIAVPINDIDGKARTIKSCRLRGRNGSAVWEVREDNKANVLDSIGARSATVFECWDGKTYPVYEVKNGKITIKDKQYPIKLIDGLYIIRKLTVSECCRLQTFNDDWFIKADGTPLVSNSQAYKQLGNSWTVEVVMHIMSSLAGQEVEVLSMYDGISAGQVALERLGCKIIKYWASEIDKYAIQTTQYHFPKTIQLGDAFDVRTNKWEDEDL